MNKKMWVLTGILLAAVFFGFEAFAMVVSMKTYNIGYILGGASFFGAILMGARNE
ncbi:MULTISPECIES: hypothetical protein [Brevibacillus]|uniref:hypothetical protein n=1 Tax=Brevibacillus TaxID=55080 RepID=UPI00039F4BAA|nr:hypothetical protein [Brevibacillus borstelensis]MBE5396787.1 hypothetical protein [Brevibacillus borstelensis]MCC0564525.1 hypothetical protein [Brevibacillus borstelensis]MCM3471121.1 hypothetical protein [Brevibacillus borstelensis]MCM3559595.1 hypothetical protein [Brevibacillus borstelensis]MCM3591307.1 hypothetical protein [Brevibacillus borstelensis]